MGGSGGVESGVSSGSVRLTFRLESLPKDAANIEVVINDDVTTTSALLLDDGGCPNG